MNHEVEVMEIARDARLEERPLVIDRFVVSAATLDGARKAALVRLASDGRTVRSLSFLAKGGLVAVVNPPAPPPLRKGPHKAPARLGRGSR
jgi:hypothetical protein